MKGKTYIITSPARFKGEIVYKYNLRGWLKVFEINATEIKANDLKWFYTNLPYRLAELESWLGAQALDVQEVPEDLSFDRFWNEYNHKVGKKVQTENAWKRMSVADKVNALIFIPKLRNQKKKEGTDMPYPSTYLSQRYFDI